METPPQHASEASVQTGLQHLEHIEDELEQIKQRTADPKRSLFNGMLQGAGAIVGSIFALVVLGWLLSILGVIPGLSSLSGYLHIIVSRFESRY